jgi:hypothetical protein
VTADHRFNFGFDQTSNNVSRKRVQFPAFVSAELLSIGCSALVVFLDEVRRRSITADLVHVERKAADLDLLFGVERQPSRTSRVMSMPFGIVIGQGQHDRS